MTSRLGGKLGFAAGAAILAALLGGCDTMNALLDDKPGNAFSDSPSAETQPQDLAFVQQAAAAGDKEVALGKLAEERSSNAEVDSFAEQMVSDHGAANSELLAIAGEREIDVPAPPAEAPGAADLATLQGKAFDAAYVDLMVKDHEEAVALFEAQVGQGSDEALVAFAEEKLPTLRAHLEHARTLQNSLQ